MEDNLVQLFSNLSLEIIKNTLSRGEKGSDEENEKLLKRISSRLCQKAFDVLLNKTDSSYLKDPCTTDYGANWGPLTLITDIAIQLEDLGDKKSSHELKENAKSLQSNSYPYINEMLKLMLLLKGPYVTKQHEPEFSFSFSGSDFFFKQPTSLSSDVLYAECKLGATRSLKSSAIAEEALDCDLKKSSSTFLDKLLRQDSEEKQETLSYSGKNSTCDPTDSISDVEKNSQRSSRRVCFDLNHLTKSNSQLTLDQFIETPIEGPKQHKLVEYEDKQKEKIRPVSPKGEELENFVQEPDTTNVKCTVWDYYGKEILENEEVVNSLADVEIGKSFLNEINHLVTDQKQHHNYAAEFEKLLKVSSSTNLHSTDNYKKKKEYCRSFFESSKDLILSIWDHEHELLRNFNPDIGVTWPSLRKISLPEYVQCVKYLLTGVSTATFLLDLEDRNFSIAPGTCIEGVTPESLADFSNDFLEIGMCFVGLNEAAITNGKCNHNRLVYQAFWKGVHEYLQFHCESVLAIPISSNLLALRAATRRLHAMITTISEISRITNSQPLPSNGGQLLSYLLSCAEKINKIYVRNLVYGIMKICCDVYFKWLLKTWLFEGTLEMQNNDFFVVQKPEKSRDRSYYLSFFMRKEFIPCFLNGLENNIFNCGKTVHLLKLFNPDNKFCQLLEQTSYPEMHLCLTDGTLKGMSSEFDIYSRKITEFCGENVTVATLREEERMKEENYELYVKSAQKELQRLKEIEKLEKIEKLKAKKEEQRRLLKEQMEFAESERERKRLEEEMINRKIEEDMKLAMQKENKVIEEEKTKMKKYYEELYNELESRKNRAEWKKRRLLLTEKRVTFLCNDNVSLEVEGDNNNVLSETKSDNNNDISNDLFNNNEVPNSPEMTERDEEENILNQIEDDIFQEPNANILESSEVQLEDLENENILTDVTDDKIRKLSTTRKEYEKATTPESKLPALTAAQQNKLKILGTRYGIFNWKTNELGQKTSDESESAASKIKEKVLGSKLWIYGNQNDKKIGLNLEEKNEEQLKDKSNDLQGETYNVAQNNFEQAKKNKLKVLGSEYGEPLKTPIKKIDVAERPLTQAQINRQKTLMTEYGQSFIEPKNEETEKIDVQSVASKSTLEGKPVEGKPVEEKPAEGKCVESEVEEVEFIKEDKSKSLLDLDTLDNLISSDTDFEKLPGMTSDTESSTTFLTASTGALDDEDDDDNGAEEASNTSASEGREKKIIKNKKLAASLENDKYLFRQQLKQYNKFFDVENYDTNEESELAKQSSLDFKKYLQKSISVTLKTQEKLANEALLTHFLREEKLLSHLNSLRCYFFLNDGEFGRSLTHNTFRTLSKCTEPHQFFERSTLTNIVNEALNYTIHNSEPNAQNLSFKIVEMPQFLNHSSHNVLSPFELSYQVKWPLNIILTDKALSKYKIIFQFLLKLKRINWTLNENFLYLTFWYKNKRLNGKVLINSPHYHKIQIYRHAMVQFIITLEDYVSANGLQLSWIRFLKDLENAENLDHLYQKHVRYIKDVLKRCFLTKHSLELLNIIHELIELGLKFHYTVKSSHWELTEGKYIHPKFQVLKTTFNEFCTKTREFMKTLRKKISTNHELRSHFLLLEKFDMKLM